MRAVLPMLVVAALGCQRHHVAIETFPLVPGLAITCFQATTASAGYAVVDDRREVVVERDHRVALAGIADDVPLASLAIEGLAIGACTREWLAGSAIVSPIIACTTAAKPGRYLVRALYTSKAFAVRPLHQVAVTAPGAATLSSQYAIATPIWQRRASLVVFDGTPGRATPLHEVARGEVALDGSVAILATPTREVTAHLIRIYDGALRDRTAPPTLAASWAQESQDAIWVWLELETTLARGPVFARVVEDGALHEIDVPADGRRDGTRVLRLPLWIDRDLRGGRTRNAMSNTVDRLAFSIANLGEVAREVWFEEPLRPFKTKKLDDAQALVTVLGKSSVRVKRRVAPGDLDRAWFTLHYSSD